MCIPGEEEREMKAAQQSFLQLNCWNSQDSSNAALQVNDGYAIPAGT
jgi:hypothetical protein